MTEQHSATELGSRPETRAFYSGPIKPESILHDAFSLIAKKKIEFVQARPREILDCGVSGCAFLDVIQRLRTFGVAGQPTEEPKEHIVNDGHVLLVFGNSGQHRRGCSARGLDPAQDEVVVHEAQPLENRPSLISGG